MNAAPELPICHRVVKIHGGWQKTRLDPIFAFEQNDGKILIGGIFGEVDEVGYGGLARLNTDGSIDETFGLNFVPSPNFRIDDLRNVRAIDLQANGKIIIGGGDFRFNNTSRPDINLARLNRDGSLDKAFSVNSTAFSIAIQSDRRIIVGGMFSEVGGVAYQRIARLKEEDQCDGPVVAPILQLLLF